MDEQLTYAEREQAARAAKATVLQEEPRALAEHDDAASLARRYELHRALIWQVWAMGTTRGQEQAEQAVAIVRRLQDLHRETAALHAWARVYLYEHGDVTGDDVHPTQEECQTGQRLHEAALQIRESLLGPDHPDVAESLIQIVSQGRFWAPFAPYVQLAARALQICERAFGPNHERTYEALEKLAQRLRTTGDYARSLAIYERLRQSYAHSYGPDDYHTKNVQTDIIWTLHQLGDYDTARRLAEERLVARAHDHDPTDEGTISDMFMLSDILYAQGDTAAVDALYARTLSTLEQTCGPNHPRIARVLSYMGMRMLHHGDPQVARQHCERGLAIADLAYGPDHSETVICARMLFELLWQQGDQPAALDLFERLLVRCPLVRPDGSGSQWELLPWLAALRWARGNRTFVQPFYMRLLAYAQQTCARDHPDIAAILHDWGTVLRQDNDVAARAPFERALQIREQALAPDHPDRLATIAALNSLLCEQGDYATVRGMYARALAACEQALGSEHPQTAATRLRLTMLPEA